MTPETMLPVIAQIAATFAGFTALVSIVDQSQGGKWARISIMRITMMLRTSLLLIFYCLLPATLLGLGISTQTAWWLAICFIFLLGLVGMFSALKRLREYTSTASVPLNQTVRWTLIATNSANLVIQVVALTRVFPLNLAGIYLLSMTIMLLGTSVLFAALISQLDLQRLENESKVEDDHRD